MKYFVEYRLPEMCGNKVLRQGPYDELEAPAHLDDIRGFEGVADARLMPVEAEGRE